MRETMDRLVSWLLTLFGWNHETNKIKKRRKGKKVTSDVNCKLLSETNDDGDNPMATLEQPSAGNPLKTGCSSKPSLKFMSEADVHPSFPPKYDSGSLETTPKHHGVYQDDESQGDYCDEVDGYASSLPGQKRESLTVYFKMKQNGHRSIIPRNSIQKVKTKASLTKNEGDDKSGSHQFPGQLESVGQRSLLCPVHHQTDVHNSMDKQQGCASLSGQCRRISDDKQEGVMKDPLVLDRQGSGKSQKNEFESELSDSYPHGIILPKDMPSERPLICNTSLIKSSMHLLATDSNSIIHGETSTWDMNESDDIHLSSIRNMTPINFSETFIKHQDSRSASMSSIDDVSHINSEHASFSEIHDCSQSGYDDVTSYQDYEGLENSETLEGLCFKTKTSKTDAEPFNTTSAEDLGCDEADGPCSTEVENIELCSRKDGTVTSIGRNLNKLIIIKPQNLESGHDIAEDTRWDKQDIPKLQCPMSGYDTENPKGKSEAPSDKKPLTTTEKRRNAIMKRLAESTKATLATFCSSGIYQNPKEDAHINGSSKRNRNVIETDHMIDRKERPMLDLISHPQTDHALQKSSVCTDISESHTEMATFLTSANDGQCSKAVVQNLCQETDSIAIAQQCDFFSTDYSENLFQCDSSSKGPDENISDNGLNVTESDGMDEYFAAGHLIDLSDTVPFSKSGVHDEGCDETDGPSLIEGRYIEVSIQQEDDVSSEVRNSHKQNIMDTPKLGPEYKSSSTNAPSNDSTTSMCVTPSSSNKSMIKTANTNLPFKTKKSRFHSFGGIIWKLSNPNVEEIVYSGFHYIGPGDKTQCFSCGIILMAWESSDFPVEEHLRHSPNCSFIKVVASLQKQWLTPFIEGAIDIVKGFNQFENAVIDTAIERLDLKDIYIFTAPQLLEEVYLIEEDKEKENLGILHLYGIQGATCQDITDEILQEELIHKLLPLEAGTSAVQEDQIVFAPIEGLEDDVGVLGAGFGSFLKLPPVQSGKENASMVIYEEHNEEVQNFDGHEEIYFSIHAEKEHDNKFADKPEEILGCLSVPRTSNEVDIRHDSGCISGEVSLHPPSEPQRSPMPEETCFEDDASSYDTDYYSEEEAEDQDLTTASELLPKTEEEKVDMEARLVTLRQTNQELRLWSACKVCLVNAVSELYIDCAHLAVCSSCTTHLQACPICRKPITNSMTVYLH